MNECIAATNRLNTYCDWSVATTSPPMEVHHGRRKAIMKWWENISSGAWRFPSTIWDMSCKLAHCGWHGCFGTLFPSTPASWPTVDDSDDNYIYTQLYLTELSIATVVSLTMQLLQRESGYDRGCQHGVENTHVADAMLRFSYQHVLLQCL